MIISCRDGETEAVIATHNEAVEKMLLNLKIKENLLLQKSRLKWDYDGDCNNKYFHSILKERRTENFIGSLPSNIGRLESVEDVKEEVRRLFWDSFKEEEYSHHILEGIQFKSLSQLDSAFSESIFSMREIKEVVWACDGSKSPASDGYNFFFIKKYWNFLRKTFISSLTIFTLLVCYLRLLLRHFSVLFPRRKFLLAL